MTEINSSSVAVWAFRAHCERAEVKRQLESMAAKQVEAKRQLEATAVMLKQMQDQFNRDQAPRK